MYQKLLTKAIINKMPLIESIIYSKSGEDAPVIVKFFGGGSYRLYVIAATAYLKEGIEGVKLSEINGRPVEDIHFYGYVTGLQEDEWGTTSFNELKGVKFPPFGLGVERDMHLRKITVKQVIAKEVY